MLTLNEANTFAAESMNFLENLITKTSPEQRDAFFSLKKELTIDVAGTHKENKGLIKKLEKEIQKNKFFYFLNIFSSKRYLYQKTLSKIDLRLKAIKNNSISSNKVLKNINLSTYCLNNYLSKNNIFNNWNAQDAFYFSLYHELGHLLQNEYQNFDNDLNIFLKQYPSITNYLNRKDKRAYNLFSFILPTYDKENLTQANVALSIILDSIFSNVNTNRNSYKIEIKTNLEECFADIYALLFMSLKNANFNQNKKSIIELRTNEFSKSQMFGHYTVNAVDNLLFFANKYRISTKKLDFEAFHKLIKIVATQNLIDLLLMRLKKNEQFASEVAKDIFIFIQTLANPPHQEEDNRLVAPEKFEVIDFSTVLGENYLTSSKENLLVNFMHFLEIKISTFKTLS
jgi:hypothetical protein